MEVLLWVLVIAVALALVGLLLAVAGVRPPWQRRG